jgi:hypothetical protein
MAKIDLTDQEAEYYKAYLAHRDFFVALIDARIFDIKDGQGILNFGHGVLIDIKRNDYLYRRKKTK